MLDGDFSGVLADIRKNFDENDLAEVLFAGAAGKMRPDELEDEGIKLANEIGRRLLVLPAQARQAGFHIEAGVSHGCINSESTQL